MQGQGLIFLILALLLFLAFAFIVTGVKKEK